MPDTKSDSSAPIYLLPIVMPVSALSPWADGTAGEGTRAKTLESSSSPRDFGTQARQICAACTVWDDSLGYAIDADEFGVRGGFGRDERRELLRRVP